MPDDINDIEEFYGRAPDYEDQRLTRHQLEFEITLRFFDEYLPDGANVLELGCATGRYTEELAKRGYRGTAVDLSAPLVERCKQRLHNARVTSWKVEVGDARSIELDTSFDAVLVMGPLYHLVESLDRSRVLENAFGLLNSGGLIFSAWISRYGLLCDLLKHEPNWISRTEEVNSVLTEGRDPPGLREGFRGYFARVDEIGPIHEGAGFDALALAGVEPVISAEDERYNNLDNPVREKWLDLLYSISREPSIVGASRHLLYVGQKRS